MPYQFNPNAQRYVDEAGRFVADSVIDNLLDQEQQRLVVRLQALTRLLIVQQIPMETWQARFAMTLRDSHLRMTTLAAGGKDQLGFKHYGAAGYQLRNQYEYLSKFAADIAGGNVSVKQALNRSRMYASSIRLTYHRVQQISRADYGFNEAMRVLDPQSRHCDSCLRHATGRRYRPVEQVTPPGVDCECGQQCRCKIYYRRRMPQLLDESLILGE